MKKEIFPCLWFDNNAGEAAELYTRVFGNSEIISENGLVTMLSLSGQRFMLLNGGPYFTITPSISFYAIFDEKEDVISAWNMLIDGGSVMMSLNSYDWSDQYGWLTDKYGVSWQLSHHKNTEFGRRFIPVLMFSGKRNGMAMQAMNHYMSVFRNSSVHYIMKYPAGMNEIEDTIQHGQFLINNQLFMCMDSHIKHDFDFNEGVSFYVECGDQAEIDYFWGRLSEGGEEGRCGWLKDRFGISWQVVPEVLNSLMSDPSRSARVRDAFMSMNKFNIEKLLNA
jgi:predicted 3-demethylubiquinone-9 3-methyltransferase (glyoxalase superfamily)